MAYADHMAINALDDLNIDRDHLIGPASISTRFQPHVSMPSTATHHRAYPIFRPAAKPTKKPYALPSIVRPRIWIAAQSRCLGRLPGFAFLLPRGSGKALVLRSLASKQVVYEAPPGI